MMTDKLSFKMAEMTDIPVIRQMADVAFRHTYKDILSPQQLEYMMDWMYSEESLKKQLSGGHVYFIAENEGRAVGYLSVEPQGKDAETEIFHLQKIYLLPEEQGKGFGKVMFCKAIEYVKSKIASRGRIELNVNRYNKALGFYEHLGMKCLSQGDFPIGNGYFMNDYIMGLEVEKREV